MHLNLKEDLVSKIDLMKYALFFCLFLSPFLARAHQPDISSTLLVETQKDTWMLEIRASLIAFGYEIKHYHGENAYKTPEAFKKLLIDHTKANLAIQFNDQNPMALPDPEIQLGHETSVIFQLTNMPSTINNISFKNTIFKNIPDNKNIFITQKKGFISKRVILNSDNEHQTKLVASDNTFEIMEKQETGGYGSTILGSVIVLIILGGIIYAAPRINKSLRSYSGFGL